MDSITPNVSVSTVKAKKDKNVKESVIANFVGTSAALAALPASKLVGGNTAKAFSCTLDENNQIKTILNDTVVKTGLDSKGVKINYIPKDTQFFDPRDAFSKKLMPNLLEQVAKEKNAFMELKSGALFLPENQMAGAGFHEIGHAMNKNFSKFGKILQKIRGAGSGQLLTLLAAIPALIGAFSSTKKSENGEDISTGNKIKNFIRKNAGKLAFLTTVPILIEEGMATIKGNKIAKEALSPEIFKKVSKGNKWGLVSYIIQAAVTTVGAYATVKIKDKLVENKKQKNNEKMYG